MGTTYAAADYYTSVGEVSYDSASTANYNNYITSAIVKFVDKEGNNVAENGLYSYFDENGNYTDGLYLSNGNTLVAATTGDISKMVSTTQATMGSLELKLHVGADATSNNQITLKIDAMSSESLGVDNIKVTGTDDTNAKSAIENISAALQRVSEQRSALGAVQNRLEHTINNLDNIVENTTSAESQIRDTDMAEEMVAYSKNNILMQAGQSMLAQANQANQGVLSLLQ